MGGSAAQPRSASAQAVPTKAPLRRGFVVSAVRLCRGTALKLAGVQPNVICDSLIDFRRLASHCATHESLDQEVSGPPGLRSLGPRVTGSVERPLRRDSAIE